MGSKIIFKISPILVIKNGVLPSPCPLNILVKTSDNDEKKIPKAAIVI